MHRLTTLALVAILSAAPVCQDRISRDISSALGLPTRGAASIVVSSAGSVRLRIGADLISFETDVSEVGAYEALGTTSLSGILIAGRSSAGGRIEHWAASSTPGVWEIRSTLVMPGLDFVGLAFDGTRLFVLDCANQSILQAPWDGAGSLSALPWSTYVTQAEVPQLAGADDQYIVSVHPSSTPGITSGGIMLTDVYQTPETQSGILLRDGPGGILSEPCFVSRFGTPQGAVVDDATAFDGGTSIMVYATPGVTFQIVNAQDAVIGSGVGAADGSPVAVALSEPLVVGETYRALTSGTQTVAEFVCLQRHGFPESFTDGAELDRIRLSPFEYHVGNAEFSMSARVHRSQPAGPRVDYLGGCLLALEGAPIVPVDNGSGINQTLITEFWVGALGHLAENAVSGQVSMEFPIANDPSLEGIVLLAQFVVFDVSGFRLSEVVGCKIQAALQ